MEMQEWKGCRLQFHYILYIIYQEKYCFRDPPRKADEIIFKTFDENAKNKIRDLFKVKLYTIHEVIR